MGHVKDCQINKHTEVTVNILYIIEKKENIFRNITPAYFIFTHSQIFMWPVQYIRKLLCGWIECYSIHILNNILTPVCWTHSSWKQDPRTRIVFLKYFVCIPAPRFTRQQNVLWFFSELHTHSVALCCVWGKGGEGGVMWCFTCSEWTIPCYGETSFYFQWLQWGPWINWCMSPSPSGSCFIFSQGALWMVIKY